MRPIDSVGSKNCARIASTIGQLAADESARAPSRAMRGERRVRRGRHLLALLLALVPAAVARAEFPLEALPNRCDNAGLPLGSSATVTVWPVWLGRHARLLVSVSTTFGATSSSMKRRRSFGYAGSSGTYAARALSTASIATTLWRQRPMKRPTPSPGFTPSEINW